MNEEKPPLGLRPRRIADIERLDEIKAAILRCLIRKATSIPTEWIDEYNDIVERVR